MKIGLRGWMFCAVLLCISILILVTLSQPAAHAQDEPKPSFEPIIGHAVNFAETGPISELAPGENITDINGDNIRTKIKEKIQLGGTVAGLENSAPTGPFTDPIAQLTPAPTTLLTGPLQSFEGLGAINNFNLFGSTPLPPDTVGDVGPNHYVQMVNAAFRVWDKNGNPLTPPRKISDLFAPLGPPCGTSNDGDPIVLYDPLADRWLLSQFCNTSPTTNTPAHEVIAISKTGDPTGAYYLYDFVLPDNKFQDYPKLAVWRDGYYMSANQFQSNPGFTAFTFGGVFAFDRQKMLVGDQTAGYIYFDLSLRNPIIGGGMLPADVDGLRPPPPGTPNYFAQPITNALRIFEFRADFANPSRSSFTERSDSPIPVAPFDPRNPNPRNDIEQPPPSAPLQSDCTTPSCYFLDSIQDRLMHRLAYRNFGTHESLVATHTVNVSGLVPNTPETHQAGIRYYELRKPVGGNFAVNEQATYAPDSDNRWMGSAAMDGQGNLAVGYSVSSLTTFPSIRYAARLATDPPNGLFQGEMTLQEGSGSQRHSSGRWGDYSTLSVDPADDSTFWFTTEYYTDAGSRLSVAGWQTRIGSFKLSNATPPATGLLQGTVINCTTGQPVPNALIEISNGASRATYSDGKYSASLLPGTYSIKASAQGYPTTSSQTVTINESGQVSADFCLTPISIIVIGRNDLSGESCVIEDGVINRGERITLNVTLPNNGSTPTTNLIATLLPTAGIIAPSDPQSYGSIQPGATASRQFSFTIGGDCGSSIVLTFRLSDDGQDLGTLTIPLNSVATTQVFAENFDNVTAPNLPPGWTAERLRGPASDATWATVNNASTTPPNSVFVTNYPYFSDHVLVSPIINLPSRPAVLTFSNRFNLESRFDGGVLEISIEGSPFADVLSIGGSFITGGYNGTISSVFGSSIAGRQAWTGTSSSFERVTLNLPPSSQGKAIRLRWRVASDDIFAASGQWIDSISITSSTSFVVGTPTITFAEEFDQVPAPALPPGWTSTLALGNASTTFWRTTNAAADTLPQSAFGPALAQTSDLRLTSPPIAIQNPNAQLSFRNRYDLTAAIDGAVLEISIAGSPFVDILTAGGSFITGGYTGRLIYTVTGFPTNPVISRQAWTGNSGGFLTTRVNLPPSAAGQQIRLRWRIGTGGIQANTAQGQFIDSVRITDGYTCGNTCATIRLTSKVELTNSASGLTALVTVRNEGTATATGVQLTNVSLNGISGSALPQSLGNIAPGGSVVAVVPLSLVPATSGSPGVVQVAGTYGNGNSFGGFVRVTIP